MYLEYEPFSASFVLTVQNDLSPSLRALKLHGSLNDPQQYFISVLWQVQSFSLLPYPINQGQRRTHILAFSSKWDITSISIKSRHPKVYPHIHWSWVRISPNIFLQWNILCFNLSDICTVCCNTLLHLSMLNMTPISWPTSFMDTY